MKRPLDLLLAVCLVAALAGWGAARVRTAFLERKAARVVEERRAAIEAAEKMPARQIADLIRATGDVVISYSGEKTIGENDITFSDPAWSTQLANVIGSASFKATAPGSWVSVPEIRFNRNHEQVLKLTGLGGILRAFTPRGGGDFVVGEETARAIHALIQQKQPGKPAEPWHGSGL